MVISEASLSTGFSLASHSAIETSCQNPATASLSSEFVSAVVILFFFQVFMSCVYAYVILNSCIVFKQHNSTQQTLEGLTTNSHYQRQLRKQVKNTPKVFASGDTYSTEFFKVLNKCNKQHLHENADFSGYYCENIVKLKEFEELLWVELKLVSVLVFFLSYFFIFFSKYTT